MKVLIADHTYPDLNIEKSIIESSNLQFLEAQCHTESDLIKAARGVSGIIVQYLPVTRKVIESVPSLKVIGRYGVGVDIIDVDVACTKGITVVNVTDYCTEEVSDHALALLFSLVRKVHILNREAKSLRWSDRAARPMRRLQGRTLGLVGFGNISKRISEKLSAYHIRIIVFDPFISPDICKAYKTERVDFEYLLKMSDYISLHTPLLPSTRGMVGSTEFGKMKKDVILINTSRGEIIDEPSMVEFLQQNQNAAAGLDVLATEGLDNSSPLINMQNVIVTPHVAWYSEESQEELQTKIAKGVVDVLQKEHRNTL